MTEYVKQITTTDNQTYYIEAGAVSGQGYGTCSSSSSPLLVTMSGYEIHKGCVVSVRFSNAVPANATMNINRQGEKPIYNNGSAITSGIIPASSKAIFVYDGTRYNLASVEVKDWNSTSGDSSISNIPSVKNIEINVPKNQGEGWRKLCDIQSEGDYILTIGGVYATNPSTFAGIALSVNYPYISMKLLWCDKFLSSSMIRKFRLVRYNPNSSTSSAKYLCSVEYYFKAASADYVQKTRFSFFGVGQGFKNIASDSDFSTILPETPDSPAVVESLLYLRESVVAERGSYYGTCSNSADTVAKTVSLSNSNFVLATGVKISVKFSYANSASSPTLNVNGTGAKAIKRYSTTNAGTASYSSWNGGSVVDLVYDGTYWQMVGFNNTTYSTITQSEIDAGGSGNRLITPQLLHANLFGYGCGYGACSTNGETTGATAYTATLDGYELRNNGIVAVHFTYAVPSNATLNINSTGAVPIYHKGSAITRGVIDDNCVAVFVYQAAATGRTAAYNLIAVEPNEGKYNTLYEAKSNKVTSLSSSSTNAQYPSAKCVYDMIGDVETLLAAI